MAYLIVKWLHVLAVIAWMAGMMYLPRLFIYHFESERGGEAEALFQTMQRRLLKGIMTPSLVAVWALGLGMIALERGLLQAPWLWLKIVLVLAMSAVHGFYARAQRAFEAGDRPQTQRFWRIMNEGPFVLLIAIVFLVVVKPF
ncbi:MAG: CopD family protein [Pseudomonadota bacterium]